MHLILKQCTELSGFGISINLGSQKIIEKYYFLSQKDTQHNTIHLNRQL